MPRHPAQSESTGLQKSCTAALPETGRDQLGRAGWMGGSALSGGLRPSPLHLCRASDSDVRPVSQHLASVSCASLWVVLAFSGCGAFTLTYSVDFIYRSAAECESETHSKRTQPLCGLQSNAEKILFWQDSHLLLCEGWGLVGGCL